MRGGAPDLGRVGHRVVAGRDQQRRVVPLHAAAGRSGVAVLDAEVGEAGPAERQPGVAGDGVRTAVPGAVAAGVQLEAAAATVVLQQKVQHPGDGVGAVLGRRAVAQHLDLSQRYGRDGRDVGPLRPVGDAVADPGDDGAPVPALAVDQHQRVVGGEAAQVGGSDESCRVPDRLGVDVVGGDQRPQLIADVGAALADDVLNRNGVDRHRRFDGRPRLCAAADDDHPLRELHRQHDVQRHRGRGGNYHPAAHLGAEAGQGERHLVRAGRQRGDRELASAVGEGGPRRIAAGRVADLYGDAGQDEACGVGDRAGQHTVLRPGGLRHQHDRDKEEQDGSRKAGSRDHPFFSTRLLVPQTAGEAGGCTFSGPSRS